MQPQQASQQRQDRAEMHRRASTMDKVPSDLLMIIADLLDYVSLLAFATTCRKHKVACNLAKFRVVRLSFTGPDSLGQTVARACDILRTARSFSHVWHLELVTPRSDIQGFEPMLHRQFSRDLSPLSPWWTDDIRRYRRPEFKSNDEWRPLLYILQQLNALKDLHWASIESLPSEIIRQLHASMPRCRLHLYNFRFRVERTNIDQPIELGPDAIELATSSAVHSVSLRGVTGPLGYDEHFDIIADMIAGAAPALRDVHLATAAAPAMHPSRLQTMPHRWQWPQGRLPPRFPPGVGSLRKLEVDQYVPNFSLARYKTLTDLNLLTSLSIPDPVSSDVSWITDSNHKFALLEHLTITRPSFSHSHRHTEPNALVTFLTALPLLSHLYLEYELDLPFLSKIVSHCGTRLKQLRVDYCFIDLSFLQQLGQLCPFIEELNFSIHRWAGSFLETAIYKTLGGLRRLEVLRLRIRSFQAASNNGDFNSLWSDTESPMEVSFFDEPEHDRAYLAMRDLAFDETLAGSIFGLIAAHRPAYSRPLERLVLWADPEMNERLAGFLMLRGLPLVLSRVACSWLCVRDLSDQRPRQCFVKRTASRDPPPHGMEPDHQLVQGLAEVLQGPDAPVVHLAWPETRHKPFDDAWRSFPLYSD